MTDTSFRVAEENLERLASLYEPDKETRRAVLTADARRPWTA